ncbi:unnamed protein product [Wickerhamomyces anomalus]
MFFSRGLLCSKARLPSLFQKFTPQLKQSTFRYISSALNTQNSLKLQYKRYYSTNHDDPKKLNKHIQNDLKKETQKELPKQELDWVPKTKEEFLARANGFSQRMRVRAKWLLKRSMRPFNVDDFSAFFSWIVMGNVLLIILGTTTFASLIIYLMNTVFAQELVAKTLGNFITKNTGMTVVFESAIVPGWRDGKISFNKCFVSKRPKNRNKSKFEKGSQADAIANAVARGDGQISEADGDEPYDDGNYTQFDLTIDQVNVSFSFSKFVNGRGILDEVEVNGLRGIVDRTHVRWAKDDDPRNYKNIHRQGDFEISSYDDSLFTIHKRQRINDFKDDSADKNSPWKRVTRCRVDALNVDHLNTGLEGPFGWITSGEVDMIGDIMVPEDEGVNMVEILSAITDSLAKEARRAKILKPESKETEESNTDVTKYFIMDLQIKLNNVKAAVPIFTNDLSYVNNALVRPIVGYINSRKTYIPINCRIVKKLEDFDGSWTVYDSLLMDDMSIEVYDAFANYVANEEVRTIRIKRVGFWTLQILFQLLLMSLGAIA